jgi:hypothetical protein
MLCLVHGSGKHKSRCGLAPTSKTPSGVVPSLLFRRAYRVVDGHLILGNACSLRIRGPHSLEIGSAGCCLRHFALSPGYEGFGSCQDFRSYDA